MLKIMLAICIRGFENACPTECEYAVTYPYMTLFDRRRIKQFARRPASRNWLW